MFFLQDRVTLFTDDMRFNNSLRNVGEQGEVCMYYISPRIPYACHH